MRFTIFLLVLFCNTFLCSQDYIDLLTISVGDTPLTNFDAASGSYRIKSLDANILIPVPLSERTALMTGINGFVNRLKITPKQAEIGLFSYGFQLGLNRTYTNGWSSTHLLIPRITSAFEQDRSSLQWGMANLIQHKVGNRSTWGTGLYINTEEQGLMLVPLLLFFTRSERGSWEFNTLFPARADFTFNLQNSLRVGLGFEGLGNSFAANLKEYGSVYIQRSSMEFSSYLQYPLTKNILLNLRGGYGLFRRFRIFEADDTVKFSLMNIFFKDPRTPLNQSVQDGPFFNLRLIYRYYLPKKN
ncbi:DUF6268 family outer membrane beta-barrel protein [Robiginitalea sp.]|nr:DUF6268 family outer membrane beta-barrel protein [Robiginitalea sp.]